MQIGDVVAIYGVDFVVTELEGFYASKSVPLRDYVEMNTLIQYEGECISIKEIVENFMQDYKSKHETINN